MGAIKRLVLFVTFLALFILITLGTGGDLAAVSGAAVSEFREEPAIILIPPSAYKTAPGDLPTFFVEQRPGEKGDGYLFVSMFLIYCLFTLGYALSPFEFELSWQAISHKLNYHINLVPFLLIDSVMVFKFTSFLSRQ